VPFLRRFDTAPLIRPILFKTIVYTLVVFVVASIEGGNYDSGCTIYGLLSLCRIIVTFGISGDIRVDGCIGQRGHCEAVLPAGKPEAMARGSPLHFCLLTRRTVVEHATRSRPVDCR
jgi:hypothetical protein